MNRSILFKIIMALVLVAAILGLGAYAYRAGMAQGLAISAQPAAGETGQATLPYFPMYYGMPFHMFGGFGFLSCLVPLFLLFLVFFAFRAMFWGGPRHWGAMHHGPWGRGEAGQGPPSIFTEWHRQAHAQPPSSTEEK
jgi:hypothetical protein